MSKQVEFFLGDNDEITVTASITPGYPGNGPESYYGASPPEPSEVEDLIVEIDVLGQKIDITDLLNSKNKEDIAEKCFEHAS